MVSEIVWGGSGIEKVVFDHIQERIAPGSVVVELGAGLVSTRSLSEVYELYSVEHNADYIGKFEKAHYIYAQEGDWCHGRWYDVEVLRNSLPSKNDQKLILIDGLNRMEILKHLDLFNPNALYIIHDTYRIEERVLANKLSTKLGRRAKFYSEKYDGDNWASI